MTQSLPLMSENSVLLASAKPSFADRSIFFGQDPDDVYFGEPSAFSWDRLRELARKRFVVGYLSYDLAESICGLEYRRGPMPAFWLASFPSLRVGDALTGTWKVWDARGGKTPCDPLEMPKTHDVRLRFEGLDQTREQYRSTVEKIRLGIERGSYYQVNYTMKARYKISGSDYDLFARMNAAQEVPFAALLRTDQGSVISGSPEHFVKLRNRRVMSKPMKGTAKPEPGARIRLKNSAKDRAENLMIVDLVRHDFGKVCSRVWVKDLFRVERFSTVYQMVSTVYGELEPGKDGIDILAASFPPGSITGAPKSSATQAIHQLERSPRGVYTGVIGLMCPWDDMRFSVAIRTCEKVGDSLWYGLGSGITYASDPSAEWEECLTKMNLLTRLCEG